LFCFFLSRRDSHTLFQVHIYSIFSSRFSKCSSRAPEVVREVQGFVYFIVMSSFVVLSSRHSCKRCGILFFSPIISARIS
jgi:hypothetical protein